jgi:hypothetical protein
LVGYAREKSRKGQESRKQRRESDLPIVSPSEEGEDLPNTKCCVHFLTLNFKPEPSCTGKDGLYESYAHSGNAVCRVVDGWVVFAVVVVVAFVVAKQCSHRKSGKVEQRKAGEGGELGVDMTV